MRIPWAARCCAISFLFMHIGWGAESPKEVRFNRDIRPILAENCFACHGPDGNTREAALRLDTKDGLFGEAESGELAVVPGDLDASTVYRRIAAHDASERMPPTDSGKELTPAAIDLVRRWIEQGAKWEGHWAFIPPQRAEPPAARDGRWAEDPIDRFILARLEAEGLSPSAAADPITLIRRLSFDLTGLPPTAAEAAAFEQLAIENRQSAIESVVDRLLASEHFGERMAMHWLDLVRYGDSGGYHSDNEHSISPYRDYVIHAFNDNMPFDRFTREQLAGDLLPNPAVEQIVATGYNRLNKTTEEGGAQPGEYLAKYAADRVRTTSGAWLGATLGCAECHDHKYDPYTTKDFYSFAAFFADVQEVGKYGGNGRPPEKMVPNREQAARLARIEAEQAELRKQLTDGNAALDDSSRKKLEQQIAALVQRGKAIESQFTKTLVTVAVPPREMRILPRGNWLDKSGQVVVPSVPEFLCSTQSANRRLTRLDLANWLVARDNPLTARVFVNRLWKMLFGTGLSKVLDDVGTQGEWPTHPELLDWLAVEFMDSGWDVKHMVKLLVTSNTYQQSSLVSEKLRERDPLNRLFARQSRWRIDAEMIRDNALAVSGLLVRKIGGPSVKPYQPAGYWSHLNFPTRSWQYDTGESQYRRGLYTHWQRTFLHPMLLAFDAPSREECTAERSVSNTPQAALTLLNDPTFVEAARAFAVRVIKHGGATTTDRINWAWREALSREPNEREVELLVALLQRNDGYYQQNKQAAESLQSVGLSPTPPDLGAAEVAAWTAVTRAILNLNETITRN